MQTETNLPILLEIPKVSVFQAQDESVYARAGHDPVAHQAVHGAAELAGPARQVLEIEFSVVEFAFEKQKVMVLFFQPISRNSQLVNLSKKLNVNQTDKLRRDSQGIGVRMIDAIRRKTVKIKGAEKCGGPMKKYKKSCKVKKKKFKLTERKKVSSVGITSGDILRSNAFDVTLRKDGPVAVVVGGRRKTWMDVGWWRWWWWRSWGWRG
ncbi:hypothetical protein OSB04_020983 [Centaurea solstitialis]|uniref:Uncharacterized protein n=1 Tax=Centaurea solstitialis TaxID=347529 RepID=A0AA38T5G8_9ASTR|nr:hypothetical protein OSB04_020983 [Centaurea solstitialis]